MPLAVQPVDVPFSGGIDTKTDPQLVQAPALLELQNAIFQQGGTLVKRNGFQPLGTGVLGGGAVTSGRALATFKNELLQISSTGEVYSYSDSQDSWLDRGRCSPIILEDGPVIRNTYSQSNPDCDTTGAVTVFAWEDTRGGIRATAVDEATGAVLLADQSITTTGSNPRVVAVGQTICLLYADSSTLSMVTLSAQSPTAFSAAVVLDTSMPASGIRLDAKAYDGLSIVAAWNYSGATRVAIVLPAGYLGSPPNGYPAPVSVAQDATGTVDVSWDSVSARFWILSGSASGLYGATLTQAFTAGVAPTLLDNGGSVVNATASFSGGTLTAYYEITAALTYNHYLKTVTLGQGGSVGTASVGVRSVGLGSKVFTQDSRLYLVANYSSALQPTAFLLDVTSSTWNIVGKGQPFLSGGLYTAGTVPKVFSSQSDFWSVPAPTRVQIVNEQTGSDGTVTTYTSYFLVGIDRLDFTFDTHHSFQSAEAGGNLLLAGGVLAMYDGQSVVEHGFHLFPENISAVGSASGGSMADGTYGISVVWYWPDAQGQIHRSAPSVPVSVTISGGGGSGSIALTIPTLRLTAKSGTRTAPIVAVFRTPASGTLYQRVGNGSADAVTSPVYSTTSSDTVSFSLTVSDATIAANEILYTTGGTLPNVAPGACNEIASSGSRVFLAGIVGQPNTVAYSQPLVSGAPAEFSPTLYAETDPAGREITGLAVLDEKTVIFKQSSIFVMTGDGPDFTGNQNTFSNPQQITGDVGTVLPESVAVTPVGIMFKSAKGLYLLDRSLNVIYAGAPVEGFNDLTYTSGQGVDGTNQVRFTTSDGPALVYDYFFRQWGTFVNLYGSDASFLAYDAISWPRTADGPNVYAYLNSAGTVFYETPGQYLDTYNPVAVYIKTAWQKLGSIQGFVKIPWVTVLGRFFSTHVLRVGVAYDFVDVISQYYLYDPDQATSTYGDSTYGDGVYGGSSNPAYQFRFRPDVMKCQSILFTFSEQEPSDGEGFALSGMTLSAAVNPAATKKLPSGQTIASS